MTVDEDGTYTLVGSDGNVVETYCDMTTDVSALGHPDCVIVWQPPLASRGADRSSLQP